MDNLYALLNKGSLLLKEYSIEYPITPHWNYMHFQNLALVGAIIAVAGLIFAQIPVLIGGAVTAVGSALIAHKIKCNIKSDLIAMFEIVLQRAEKTYTPRLDINLLGKLGQKEDVINKLKKELEELKK